MTKPIHTVERLIPPAGDSDIRALAAPLVEVVESGSAVSFLAPLTIERARWKCSPVRTRAMARHRSETTRRRSSIRRDTTLVHLSGEINLDCERHDKPPCPSA